MFLNKSYMMMIKNLIILVMGKTRHQHLKGDVRQQHPRDFIRIMK